MDVSKIEGGKPQGELRDNELQTDGIGLKSIQGAAILSAVHFAPDPVSLYMKACYSTSLGKPLVPIQSISRQHTSDQNRISLDSHGFEGNNAVECSSALMSHTLKKETFQTKAQCGSYSTQY